MLSLVEEGRQSQAPAPPSSPECQGTSTQQSPHCADSASHMKSLSHGPLPCSESIANIYPSAPPGPRALAHSVPPGKAKRGQTCLPRQMIHHLDSPTVCLSRGVALPEDARRCQQQLRAQLGSAMSAELLQAPLAQPARLCFLTNTRAQTSGANWVLGDLGSTPSWYRRGNHWKYAMYSLQSQRSLRTVTFSRDPELERS